MRRVTVRPEVRRESGHRISAVHDPMTVRAQQIALREFGRYRPDRFGEQEPRRAICLGSAMMEIERGDCDNLLTSAASPSECTNRGALHRQSAPESVMRFAQSPAAVLVHRLVVVALVARLSDCARPQRARKILPLLKSHVVRVAQSLRIRRPITTVDGAQIGALVHWNLVLSPRGLLRLGVERGLNQHLEFFRCHIRNLGGSPA